MNVANKDIIKEYQKPIKITIICLLSLGFVGSIIGAIFGGDEFKTNNQEEEVKGLLKINEASYNDSYITGDKFIFDKEKTSIRLIAKDPLFEKLVNIKNLPASEYGFMVNGQGEYYQDASSITMTTDVKSISVVSRVYRELRCDLPVNVYGAIDESKLSSTILMEAENADLYDNSGNLLTQEDKETKPTAEKPYLSNKGTDIKGQDCSGGAALRNISSGMKVEFNFVSSTTTTVDLNLMICQRNKASNFDDGYKMMINGNLVLTNHIVPAGDGYFTPYTINLKDIKLKRGVNKIVLSYNLSNPHNLDALEIVASDNANILGAMSVIEGEVK